VRVRLRTRRQRIGGFHFYWREALAADPRQQRPAIVLVHGLGVCGRYMLPTALELAKSYRVYVPDLPGFGQSDRPLHALDVPGLARALLTWMDAVKIDRPLLLANSLGCQICVDLAARDPRHTCAMVLTGPTIDPSARRALPQILRLGMDAFFEPPAMLCIAAADYLRIGPMRMWQTLRFALEDDIASKLPLVTVPTLIVRGSHDPVAPQQWAEQAAALLPRGRLAVIRGAGHAVNFARPRELAALVDLVLRR
jgi:2-hydroxy-6-oxonona-2,4-dienedioate hydrolase